jgi:hypothetical protein
VNFGEHAAAAEEEGRKDGEFEGSLLEGLVDEPHWDAGELREESRMYPPGGMAWD